MSASNFNSTNPIDSTKKNAKKMSRLMVDAKSTREELIAENQDSPIGRLLEAIGSLPEVRQEKVDQVRSQIDRGEYNIGDNLDVALDRVIEEIINGY